MASGIVIDLRKLKRIRALFHPVCKMPALHETVLKALRRVDESIDKDGTTREQKILLARFDHELRAPLATLRTAAALIVRSRADPKALERVGAVIDRQVACLARLLDDLCQSLRNNRDELTMICEDFDLTELLQDTISVMHTGFRARGQEICLAPPLKNPMQMFGDPIRIMQVFVNLLENASKYTSDGGLITVSAQRCGHETEVRIRDNGIGISGEMLTAIFEPYVREHEATLQSQHGRGIGLSLVREIVRAHGGTVFASSSGRGCGSEFVVRLPRLAKADGTRL